MGIAMPDLTSLIQNHCIAKRSANVALYEPKASVYFRLTDYLAHPFSHCTAYERISDTAPSYCPLSREEIERLKFDAKHLFSDNVCERLKEISSMLEELRNVDRDLNELFDALEYGDVERYVQIKDALLGGECTEESERILDELEITLLHKEPWQNRARYNYRELEREYTDIKEQYVAAVSAVLDEINSEIAHC